MMMLSVGVVIVPAVGVIIIVVAFYLLSLMVGRRVVVPVTTISLVS